MNQIRPMNTAATPAATPEDCPLMEAVIAAAREMFPGDPWEDVEPHLRRAWRSIREPTPWEEVHAWMRIAWAAATTSPAANDGAGPVLATGLPPAP